MTKSLPDTGLTTEINLKKAVFNQLFMGPSYVEAAAALLRAALEKQYPTLDLDPYTTVVGEPAWDIVNGEIVEVPTRYEALSDMLAEQIVENDPLLLIDGLHFLSRLPLSIPVVHLPVRIEQIGCLINELTPAIFAACQEKQLDYGNASSDSSGPHWRALSETLRKIWDVKQVDGWTATECHMARQLFLHPTLQGRKDNGLYDTHASLIDINIVDDNGVKHRSANAITVLTGTINNEEVMLTHSMVAGYKKFDSRQALEQTLPDHVYPKSGKKIQWRFFEPSENIFDQAACAIISSQVAIISDPATLNIPMSEEGESLTGPDRKGDNHPGPQWFKNKLPDWLRTASASDQNMFAELLRDLSALNGAHAGKTYLDDIPSIRSFAVSALKTQMESEHAGASTLDMENIEIQIRSVVVWGSFVVPGKIETTRFSLVELALQNLIALPLGDKTVTPLNGEELPDWMTADYIANVVSKIDIGRTYPQRVKGKLLDDPAESKRRENLYTSQLRIQLPMLALENKLRGQGGIDERGYRYVAALMEPEEADRKVDGQPIVVRRLAFVPESPPGTEPDTVANMFVIGPQDSNAGPCLLYRPLLEPQLCQYPSFSNLLYAIRQTTSLRHSVLAWLPDEVRNSYSRYIFPGPLPSPWSIVEFVTNPLAASLNSGPIRLSNETLGADFLPVLFKANAEALVELADRQSVSNSESRWESFKQAGWLIFNLALPYLGNTVGNAIWLWQILDDLEKLTQSDETVGTQAKWEVVADLLSNIAMAATSIALERARKTGSSRLTETEHKVGELESLPEIIPEPEIEKLPPAAQTLPAIEHYDTLHTSGALISQAPESATLLAPLSIDKPENPGQPKSEGPLAGLYEQGDNRYAQISGKWFKVAVAREQVTIIDGNDSTRVGPLLTSNTQGQWQIETRLRLRTSGSADIMQKVIADANRRSIQLFADLNHLEVRRLEEQKLLTMDAQQMSQASGASRDAKREVYLNTLKSQRESYEEALKLLLEWPVSQTRPDSSRTRLGYLNAQINFTFAEIDTLGERFTPVMKDALEMGTSGVENLQQQHVDTANSMIQLGEEMTERLDYMETRFSRLKKLGRDGFEFVRQHRKKMPAYKSDDIRLTQLDMYRHLCLSLESVHTTPEGWTDLNQVVDNATVAFQSLRDAIDERSVIRLDEQIDALGSLTEQFTAIAEHLKYVTVEYQDNARMAQLNRFGRQVDTTRKRALRHLAQALDERSARRSVPTPYQERPRARKKFIRTRFWGLVSGEPRLSKMYEETDWVDVKKPFSDEILVTFHRKAAGEWVQHLKLDTPQVIPTLEISVTKGQALIDGLPAFKAQVEEKIKQPGITPTGVGMVINAHARRMNTINFAIRKALEQVQSVGTNETTGASAAQTQQQRAAEFLRVQLEKESKALYALGFTTEQQVIEQSPPTMGNILWLKERQQISITRQKKRQRIKGAQYEYLDRYEIRSRADKKTLWFADFHYSKSWTPEHAFLDARLKTPEQVAREKPIDTSKRLSQPQLLDLYRSEIDVEQAKAVFFANSSV